MSGLYPQSGAQGICPLRLLSSTPYLPRNLVHPCWMQELRERCDGQRSLIVEIVVLKLTEGYLGFSLVIHPPELFRRLIPRHGERMGHSKIPIFTMYIVQIVHQSCSDDT